MPSLEDNTTQVGAHTDNRHIMSTKSQRFLQTPQDIMEEYNECSVGQYTAYPCYGGVYEGEAFVFSSFEITKFNNHYNNFRS